MLVKRDKTPGNGHPATQSGLAASRPLLQFLEVPPLSTELDRSTRDPLASSGRGSRRLARFARSRWAGPLLVLAICCGFCWKLVLSHEYTWIDNADIVQMDVPRLQFQQASWGIGRFPLWDPHLWCGQPFLGQIVGAAFPLTWPLFFLPSDASNKISLDALNWYFVFLHFLAAFAAYALCREVGVSRLASVLGGFAYSFDGIIGATLWPEVLGSLLVAPLVFLYLFRALRRHQAYGSAALCGMFLGGAWLAGHHEVPIYLTVTVVCIWAFDFFRAASNRLQSLWLASTTGLFALLTSGFQTIPGYEYAKLAVRWVGIDHPVGWSEAVPYRIHEGGSLLPSSIISMMVPWSGGNSEAFLGIGILALAAVAVCTAWRRQSVPLVACIGLAGLFFAFGGINLLHGIAYSILPIFGKARIPLRILAIFDLAVAVLAAVGLDSLASVAPSKAVTVVRRTLVAFGSIVLVTALVAAELNKGGPRENFYVTALCALALASVVSARQAGPLSARGLRVAVFALVFFELGNYTPTVFRERAAPQPHVLQKLTEFQDIAEYLRKQPGPVRVNLDNEPFNFGDWEGIDMLTGFGAGATSNIIGLDWPHARTQNLLAVQFAVTKQAPRSDQELVFHGRSGANVLKNIDALPRVRIVHRVERASSVDELHNRLGDPSFDAASTAIMTAAAPALESCGGGEGEVVSRTANAVDIRAELACRGMLILADTWYPGWTAKVDGRDTPIYQAYGALRGVVLGTGPHRVEFRYRPASAWIGAAFTVIGVLGACALALLVAVRRTRT